MSYFRVEQEVVCVDDNFCEEAHNYCKNFSRRNRHYTIRAVGLVPDLRHMVGYGLKFAEIANPVATGVRHPGEPLAAA